MKKIFSKKMAFVYGWLAILSIIGCVMVIAVTVVFAFSGLPTGVMPISHIPQPLFFTSMFFGILAIMCHWRVKISTVIALALMGILFIVVFSPFYSVFQKAFIQNSEVKTTTVVNGEWKRNYNLGYGVVVIKTICISPGFVVDVYEGTKIYEQDEISQQKQQVEIEALRPGQVVDIEVRSFVRDTEIMDLLSARYDPQGLDITVLFGAIEITIRKGEFSPVDPNVGNGVCEILPEQ